MRRAEYLAALEALATAAEPPSRPAIAPPPRSSPTTWSGPSAPESAPRAIAVPDLCRRAVALLDALRLADAEALALVADGQPVGRSIRRRRDALAGLARALHSLDARVDGEALSVWGRAAEVVETGLVDAARWPVELLHLAVEYEGERTTEPGEVGQ